MSEHEQEQQDQPKAEEDEAVKRREDKSWPPKTMETKVPKPGGAK